MSPDRHTKFKLSLISIAIAMTMAACGGGGGDSTHASTAPSGTTPTPAPTPAPTPTPTPTPTPNPEPAPALSKQPIDIGTLSTLGTATWPDGDTASGGQGQAFGNDVCVSNLSETYHVHAHLAIIRDGNLLAIPAQIGLLAASKGCSYLTHTHDSTGVVHVEADGYRFLTLGQFFQVWGQPLTETNVAGFSGQPIRVYVNDGATLQEVQSSDWGNIELTSHRSITIVIGAVPSEIPSYTWPQGM